MQSSHSSADEHPNTTEAHTLAHTTPFLGCGFEDLKQAEAPPQLGHEAGSSTEGSAEGPEVPAEPPNPLVQEGPVPATLGTLSEAILQLHGELARQGGKVEETLTLVRALDVYLRSHA